MNSGRSGVFEDGGGEDDRCALREATRIDRAGTRIAWRILLTEIDVMIQRVLMICVFVLGVEQSTSWVRGEEQTKLDDFKLTITQFGPGHEPLGTEEVVIRNGLAYHFVSGESLEVILLDPTRSRLELIDLNRKVRTEVTFRRLEMFQEDLLRAVSLG